MIQVELKKDYTDNQDGSQNPTISIIDLDKKQVLCTFSVIRKKHGLNEPFKLEVSYHAGSKLVIFD